MLVVYLLNRIDNEGGSVSGQNDADIPVITLHSRYIMFCFRKLKDSMKSSYDLNFHPPLLYKISLMRKKLSFSENWIFFCF